MERDIYARIRRCLRGLGRRRPTGRHRYTDAGVLEVYLWAVLNDRPVCWACDASNWPSGRRRGPLPDASTVCRRMRTRRIERLIERLRRTLDDPIGDSFIVTIDGKALPIGPHSHDRQSGYGRAASGKARGYKLHALVGLNGSLLTWRVAPMNVDERTMARRMLGQIERTGYILADANYDANRLYEAARERGVQLVAPRRGGRGKGLGHRRHSPARLRAVDMVENDQSGFTGAMTAKRWNIERYFGWLCSLPGGLGYLPAWVRGWRRVRNWVAAKLTILAARRSLRSTPLMQ